MPAPVTNNELIATAFFAHSTDLLAQMAGLAPRLITPETLDIIEVY